METKIIKKGKTFEKLLKAIRDLNKETIEVGHFAEQGNHYSKMSYPKLLEFWAFGAPSGLGFVKQDVRKQFVHDYFMSRAIEKEPMYVASLKTWSKTTSNTNSTSLLLTQVGGLLKKRYMSEFDKRQGPFMMGTVTPLFETGDLMRKTKFRTSKQTTLR